MMKRVISIYLLGLISLAACQKSLPESSPADGTSIYLSVSLEDDIHTRVPYVPTNDNGEMLEAPTPEYPLSTDVWGSTTAYKFQEILDSNGKPLDGSGTSGEVAIHTDARFRSGEPQLLRSAIYNEAAKPVVYFVAFTPMSDGSESWSTSDGTKATFAFSGNDDVMFAPQVSGRYAQDFSNSPLLHFRHLLTWLRVEFKAESKEVADSWGAIKSMKIRSKNTVTVDLSSDAYSSGAYDFEEAEMISSNLNFSNETSLDFYKTTEEESYVGSQLTMKKKFTDERFPESSSNTYIPYLQTEELAYVMCSPVNATATMVVDGEDVASPEYYIDLVTENRSVTIPVDLRIGENDPFLKSTRGKQFTLKLNFKMGNTVYLSTTVQDWGVAGLVIGDFGDDDIQ